MEVTGLSSHCHFVYKDGNSWVGPVDSPKRLENSWSKCIHSEERIRNKWFYFLWRLFLRQVILS